MKIILGFILLAIAMPWICDNIFIHDEDFIHSRPQNYDFQVADRQWPLSINFTSVRGKQTPTFRPEKLVTKDETYVSSDFFEKLPDIEIGKGICLDARFLKGNYILLELKLRALDLGSAKVAGNIIIKGRFIKDDMSRAIGFTGKLISKDITVNSELFRTIGMCFKIVEDELDIESLRIGKTYELKGKVSLVEPFETELRFEVKRADMKDLAIIARAKNPEVVLGIMNGAFNIKGNLSNLVSDGFLETRNGKVGPVEYDSADVKIKGFGPIVSIVDSSVKQGNGSITIEGCMDLRNIAKGKVLDGVRVRADMMPVVWNGWDITSIGQDKLSMTKDISDNMCIGFKTEARESVTTYYDKENQEEMSLEYKLGIENLKMKLMDNEEFFGIEHKVKF